MRDSSFIKMDREESLFIIRGKIVFYFVIVGLALIGG